MKNKILTYVIVSIIVGVALSLLFLNNINSKGILIMIGISSIYSFAFGFGNKLMNDALNKKYSWVTETKKRLTFGIIGTLIVNALLTIGITYALFIILNKNSSELFFQNNYLTLIITFNSAILISAILHAKAFMNAWIDSSKKQVAQEKQISTLANAQFESLKNQLDPHFLFNSLNVLSALIEENPRKASQFTNDLSQIYRYVLEQKNKTSIPIKEELNFAKAYAHLLKTRFEDAIIFHFKTDKEIDDYQIIPLSLQLLIENIIKHNMATSHLPLHVNIKNNKEYIIIENNVQLRNPSPAKKGIGLENIIKRYQLLTDKKVIIHQMDDKFSVKIPILTKEKNHQ